jgi:hypothetical protein
VAISEKQIEMKKLLAAVFILFSLQINAQDKKSVRIQNDTIFHEDKPSGLFSKNEREGKAIYFIASLDKKPQAALFFSQTDTTTVCTARFPALALRYDVVYSKVDIEGLLDSYYKNKVLMNGVIDSGSLAQYCKEREIELHPLAGRKINRPEINDSIMAKKAQEELARQITFSVRNDYGKQLSIQIGKPSVNRTVLVKNSQALHERAYPGDTVCFMENKTVIGCVEVKAGIKRIYIDSEGKTGSE